MADKGCGILKSLLLRESLLRLRGHAGDLTERISRLTLGASSSSISTCRTPRFSFPRPKPRKMAALYNAAMLSPNPAHAPFGSHPHLLGTCPWPMGPQQNRSSIACFASSQTLLTGHVASAAIEKHPFDTNAESLPGSRLCTQRPGTPIRSRNMATRASEGAATTEAKASAAPPQSEPASHESAEAASPTLPKSSQVKEFRRRLHIADVIDGDLTPDDSGSWVGRTVSLTGWVRTVRVQKAFSFIELNDGSCLHGIQLVAGAGIEGYGEIDSGRLTTGAAIAVEGEVVESQGKGQKVEIKATKLKLIGESDATTYPLQKKRHSLEFLRSIAHLRPRTNTIGAVSRVRSALAQATHRFFQDNGFHWVASPIITAADCEGAGEQFCVTTLIPPPAAEAGGSQASGGAAIKPGGSVDWSRDFFRKPAFLTVSGQLNAEVYACALHDVYTFGPTFRAENSNTSRHLAEFWMIEPELAFADLSDDMACATAYIKYILRDVMERCEEDFRFFEKMIEPGITERLSHVLEKDFQQITYTEAVALLQKSGEPFEFPVEWGVDLQSEHERFLTESVFRGQPLIVTDYPKDIKAFYMRQNDDGRTVAAMDVLVPRVGELIGGSQREERLDVLERRMDELGLNKEAYWWYLDLRRYGSVPHAGFGVGFERLVQFVTGVENIRDAIPFPRVPGSAEF